MSMCHEFSSQGLGLRILELMIAGPKSGGLRVPGLGSQVLILDYTVLKTSVFLNSKCLTFLYLFISLLKNIH